MLTQTDVADAAADVAVAAPLPDVILMGRDDRGRPHASLFRAADAEGARAAAAAMGMHAVAADRETLRDLATKLPAGRLFASGKGFVPFASTAVFDRLMAASGLAADVARAAKAAGKPAEGAPATGAGDGAPGGRGGAGGAGSGPKPPADWPDIKLGVIVLAQGDGEDAWYRVRAVATKIDDQFVLRWVDYPDAPEITRKRAELALMHPASEAAAG